MDKSLTFALLAALPGMVFATATTTPSSAEETDPHQILVTATPSPSETSDAAAGAGFLTSEVTPGPIDSKAWLDTPYSSTTVSQPVIVNQQAKSVSELLKYSPGTQMQARGGMDVGRPQSRGMQGSVMANSRLDGLNIVATTAFPVEMLERLEVLNSLTGALYGPASPAGQFNFVAKRPTAQRLNRVTVGYQSRNAWSGHADLAGYVDDDRRFGYRLNLLNEEGEGRVDESTLRRKLVALALDWTLRPGTQLQFNASHYTFLQKGYVGAFSYGAAVKLPAAPDAKKKNFTLPTAGSDLTTDTFSGRLIHYINEEWKLTAGIGWQQADRAMRSVSSTLADNTGRLTRAINDSAAAGRFRVLSNTATLNGHAQTGIVEHDLALGTTGSLWTIYSAKGASQRYPLGSTSFYHPASLQEPADGKIRKHGDRYKSSASAQQSVIIGDTLTFTPRWSAQLYLSHSWLETRNYTKQGKRSAKTSERGFSPNAALMYKITPSLMTWVSYADSLEQGGSAPVGQGIKNEGQTLDPYRSQQYEIGLKQEVRGMQLAAALFYLQRPFAYVDPSDRVYKEQGQQLNKGIELTGSGSLWQDLNIYGGVTFLDPRLKKTLSTSTRNKRVVGVPEVRANLLMEYALPAMPELVYSANVHYTGRRAANDTNSSWAGSYTTLDLGGRYATKLYSVPATLRLTVNNLTNRRYWASIFPSDTDGGGGSASAFPGAGREVRAAVTFDF